MMVTLNMLGTVNDTLHNVAIKQTGSNGNAPDLFSADTWL
jgi:hypothetical protein